MVDARAVRQLGYASFRVGGQLLVACMLLLGALAPSAHAAAATMRDLNAVSGSTPFPASCTPSVQPLPADAPGEPRIAVDPRDPKTIVLAYGQLPSIVTVSSRDGGRSWARTLPPGLSRCTGGSTDFTGDPFVSIGADGTAYLSSVPAALPIPSTTLLPRSWIAVNRSVDHGASWSTPTMVTPDDGNFWDKGSVTADPVTPGLAYEAFIKVSQPDGASAYVATTQDGGRTFTAPQQNVPDQQLSYPHDPQLLVLPDSTLVEILVQFNGSDALPPSAQVPVRMLSLRSRDGGAHWSTPQEIAQAPNFSPTDPDSGQQLDAATWPSAAVGRDGTVYVVWTDIQSASASRILLSKSVDDGRTWARPAPVATLGGQAWTPTVAANSNGTVGVTWYDARNDHSGDGQFTTDVWFAHSHDAGATWEQAHLAGPFDILTAGRRNGRPFMGDYFGLAATPDGFVAAFDQAQPQSGSAHSAVFFAHIGVSAPPKTPVLRLSVDPRQTTVGRRTRFRFTVTTRAGAKPTRVAGATILISGHRARTNRRGHATIRVALQRRGTYRARATLRGYRSAQTLIRATQPLGSRTTPTERCSWKGREMEEQRREAISSVRRRRLTGAG